jgi:thiol-disulfide isomerase/thioredoxin
MAGALFMAGRIAAVKTEPAAAPQPQVETMEAPALEANSHPSFSLMGLDGEMHDFDEYDGRHRLLNFWATWCAPCRREIPLLKDFQAEQGDDGILVIGIAVDVMEDVQKYAEAAEFNYPILVGEMDAMAVAEQSGLQFHAMPFTMIVTADGEFLNAHFGELHRPDLNKISDVLARLDAGEIGTDTARQALEL